MSVKFLVSHRGQNTSPLGDGLSHQLSGDPSGLVHILSHETGPAAARQVGVEGNAGNSRVHQLRHSLLHRPVIEGAERNARAPLFHQLVQQLHGLPRQVRPAAPDQHLNARVLQFLLGHADPLLHFRAKLIVPVGQQNPQGQRNRRGEQGLLVVLPVRHVSRLLDRLQHPLTHLRADIRAVIEDTIHSPPGYPGQLRHHLNRRTLSHSHSLPSCVLLHMFF